MKTQTGVYFDDYMKSDRFFWTYNSVKSCVEVLDFNSFPRIFLYKKDFEKFWDQMDDPEFKKIESLEKLEDKWKFVWWISRTLMR